MFSTLFYIFLLIYEGLYSSSSSDYNTKINEINLQIQSNHLAEALVNTEKLRNNSFFINLEVEKLRVLLHLKVNSVNKYDKLVALSSDVPNDILSSYFLAKRGDAKKGLGDLRLSIIANGGVDTLVKTFELEASNLPQSALKKQQNSSQMISLAQKINTQEALSLLELMKKKQKNLIY
jgi:hypothetical protein